MAGASAHEGRIGKALYLSAILTVALHLGGVRLWSFSFSAGVLALSVLLLVFRPGAHFSAPLAVAVPLAAYLSFFAVSASQTILPHRTAIELLRLATVLLAFIGARAFCRTRDDIRLLACALAALGAALSLFGLVQYLGGLPNDWWDKPHFLSSVFRNHNHFAGFIEILLPVALGLTFAERDASKKALGVFVCALMGTAFLLTMSRGGVIALTAGLFFMFGLLVARGAMKASGRLFFFFAGMTALAALAFGLDPLLSRLSTFRTIGVESEPIVRWIIWTGTRALIAAHPLWGTGPGTFELAFLRHRPEGFWDRAGSAHNDYLEVAADCGVPALVAVLVFFAAIFACGILVVWRDESRLRIGLGAGALAALVALAVHSAGDFNFHIPGNAVLFAAVIGILFSLDYESGKLSTMTQSIQRVAAALAALVAVAVIGGAVFLGSADFFLWKGDADNAIRIDRGRARSYFERGIRTYRTSRLLEEPARTEGVAKALADFEAATQLNRHEPFYAWNRLRAMSRLGVDIPADERVIDARAIVALDPNDPQILYLTGKTVLEMSAKDRNAASVKEGEALIERAMKLNSFDWAYRAYRALWRYHRDIRPLQRFVERVPESLPGFVRFLEKTQLWAEHRAYRLRLLGLDPGAAERIALAHAWNEEASLPGHRLSEFETAVPESVMTENLFYRNGEIRKTVNVQRSPVRIVVNARGTPTAGAFPMLEVLVDGRVVDELYIRSILTRSFYTALELAPGEHVLSFRYVNDLSVRKPKASRNIWIENIQLQYTRS